MLARTLRASLRQPPHRALRFSQHFFSSTPHLPRQPIPIPTPPQPDYDNPSPDALSNMTPLPTPRSITPRRALLLFDLTIPPSSWPSHLETMSPLLTAAGKFKSQLAINATYIGGEGSWPGLRDTEVYPARLLYNDGKVFQWDEFRIETLETREWRDALSYEPGVTTTPAATTPPEILVCTHGARDCRCADEGYPLVGALRELISSRGLDIPVREVSHVGGHKWAANALVVPCLDMLSNLREGDAGVIVDFALGNRKKGYEHWRGRIGWSVERQGEFFEKVSGGREEGVKAGEVEGTGEFGKTGKLVTLKFRTFEGQDKEVNAGIGDTLLEVAQVHGLPSMEGMCGGNLECATCHCYLKQEPRPAPIPEPSEDELDMLGYAVGYRDGSSRLGCQIEVTPELAKWCQEGGVIDLPRF